MFQKIADRVGATKFLGYEKTAAASRVVALLADGKEVDVVGPFSKRVAVIVAETPFYGEQGGQMGDAGTITSAKARLRVRDCKRPVSTLWVHLGEVESGELRVGDTVELTVDAERRDDIRRNHSATHLLHWALRHVLGAHVTQKGSLVAPDRLRFDFSHFAPLDRRREAEGRGSGERARARQNVATDTAVLAIADAKKAGAIAFFGEKYGDTVRVVTMGESKEFCGGTHVARTGDIAFFKLTEETGVAQGVRRIEAVTGEGALAYVRKMEDELRIRAPAARGRVRGRRAHRQAAGRPASAKRRSRSCAASSPPAAAATSPAEARDVGGVRVLATRADVADPKALREVADQLRDKIGSGVIVLAGVEGDKIALVAMVTPDLIGKHHAGKIVGEVAKAVGGKGGGRADMAQGGGSDPAALDAALANVFDLVRG